MAVLIATVVIAIRFRYRPGKNENPRQVHGNTKLEIGWTIVPALILATTVPTVSTIFDLAKDLGPDAPAGHRRRQAVVVAVRVPGSEGHHRRRVGDPGRSARQDPSGRARAPAPRRRAM
ncbi:MAG: cytochrome c oxidase subunit II transmembrane domain-containing protein [Acidimicrobiia bacterium]